MEKQSEKQSTEDTPIQPTRTKTNSVCMKLTKRTRNNKRTTKKLKKKTKPKHNTEEILFLQEWFRTRLLQVLRTNKNKRWTAYEVMINAFPNEYNNNEPWSQTETRLRNVALALEDMSFRNTPVESSNQPQYHYKDNNTKCWNLTESDSEDNSQINLANEKFEDSDYEQSYAAQMYYNQTNNLNNDSKTDKKCKCEEGEPCEHSPVRVL